MDRYKINHLNLLAMKKFGKWLLLLAVAGATMSCEKSVEPTVDEFLSDAESSVQIEECPSIVGLWVLEYEKEVWDGMERFEYTFRFYKDGTGYCTMDSSGNEHHAGSQSRSGQFTYEVKDDTLYILYPYEKEYALSKIKLEENTLVIYDIDGNGHDYTFTRREDADMRFIGDWSAQRKDDKYYYDDHIQFVTPGDCMTYYYKYDTPTSRPAEGCPGGVWFKYVFDDETITITYPYSTVSYMKKYYRFDGGKLYLSDTKDGREVCYTKVGEPFSN